MRLIILLMLAGLDAAWLLPSQNGSKIIFENTVGRSGITYQMRNSVTPQKHQVETMLAGVAVFDYNNETTKKRGGGAASEEPFVLW